jgi:hypothetical protein
MEMKQDARAEGEDEIRLLFQHSYEVARFNP